MKVGYLNAGFVLGIYARCCEMAFNTKISYRVITAKVTSVFGSIEQRSITYLTAYFPFFRFLHIVAKFRHLYKLYCQGTIPWPL